MVSSTATIAQPPALEAADAVKALGVGAAALHAYLLRAVKTKEVERDGDRYRLPQPIPDEFAAIISVG
jgi:hypothetical protein